MKALLRDLPNSVWFLDYDGTLCPHLEVWEGVGYNPADIYDSVANLAKKSQGVWWNTGRRVESLGSVNSEFLKFPGFFVHGSVYWDATVARAKNLGVELPQELPGILVDKLRQHELSYRLEVKPTAARIAAFRKTQKKYLKKFAESLDIKLPEAWEWRISGRGAEILQKACTKGTCVEYAYEQGLVDKGAIPIVAGDDIFDRAAMEFALANNGYAILVGEACGWITEIPHRSSQVVYFREPRDLLGLIRTL